MGAFDDWAEHVGFQARPPRTLNEAHISIKFLLERTEEIAEKLLRDSVSLMDQVKDKLPWVSRVVAKARTKGPFNKYLPKTPPEHSMRIMDIDRLLESRKKAQCLKNTEEIEISHEVWKAMVWDPILRRLSYSPDVDASWTECELKTINGAYSKKGSTLPQELETLNQKPDFSWCIKHRVTDENARVSTGREPPIWCVVIGTGEVTDIPLPGSGDPAGNRAAMASAACIYHQVALEGTATPQAKQALLHATNDFKSTLNQAKELANVLPGGEMLVDEQDDVIEVLERIREHKRQQLVEFASRALTSPAQGVSAKMEIDSTASTPYAP
ncbi:hypothetical protein SERLADRAFT_442964 [Serpula lacrymans var. lacrymans S7.9]|uniref:Uncharacterized protein n=1 Tax=Serpula lacrymans var. lacrymans (strain S7.9) TaxID=578457 RepID=F8PB47_SERL9|nr:uncharacterized protein SERLADRAFT_442964 [Serpula lacrymans var. lacrymans S7.9]EGO19487.1 hypothetical protein SERLADRAFT_442964 [Serpula lacrymans var. lacrymans S7.9]